MPRVRSRHALALVFTIIASGASRVSMSQIQTAGAPTAVALATQPGPAYALVLGPSSIDDGLSHMADTGQTASKGLSAVADAFGNSSAPAAPATVTAAKDLDAKIPASEYDLVKLAQTLPDDPDALYRFVTDRIMLDDYEGVMRGPLVTWMSRAGSPTDKAVLLAWLLISKHIPYQFVRGTLSPTERALVAARTPAVQAATSIAPRVAAYTSALARDGSAFAIWARGLLRASNVTVGDDRTPADRVSSRHYWIQIVRNNTTVDLDPTLAGTVVGSHLGTIDASVPPTAVLPTDEWHKLQVRLTASFANGTTKTLIDHTDTVPALAYAPIRLLFAPPAGVDPMNPGGATAFDVALWIGAAPSGTAHLDLNSGSTALQSVVLEIRRSSPNGPIVDVARRSFIDARTPAADRPYLLAGMTTIVVAPGTGTTAFATHMQFHALQQLAQAVADAQGGVKSDSQPWYPIRLIDYYRRDDAMADAVASTGGARLFRDRPNVAMLRTSFVRSGTGADIVTTFDIADNGMSSLSVHRDAVVTENMIRGYADTQIERDVVEGPSSPGTIALLAGAAAQGVTATVLTQAPSTTDALRDGLDRTFAAGQVAIAPPRPLTVDGHTLYGWWAIDPRTGNSVGRMTGGAGQDLAEESFIISRVSQTYTLYGQAQAATTCAKNGFGSAGCAAAVCASLASYAFGGGTAGELASNYVAGQMATAGCSNVFGTSNNLRPLKSRRN